MYCLGVTLSVRLNSVLKAAGLSNSRSAAVWVTDAPAVSLGSAPHADAGLLQLAIKLLSFSIAVI